MSLLAGPCNMYSGDGKLYYNQTGDYACVGSTYICSASDRLTFWNI
jgi:hypothetical protein